MAARSATLGARRTRRPWAVVCTALLLVTGSGCSDDDDAPPATPTTTGTSPPSEDTATRAPRPRPDSLVSVFGAPGTFGALDRPAGDKPDGDDDARPRVVPVPGFAFAPGASAAFAALTPHGRVVMGTFPQTNNQVDPTGATMSVAVVDPLEPSFATLTIPSTAGLTDVGSGTPAIGGADVSDVCLVTTAAGPRIVGVSVSPAKPWPASLGVFPSLIALEDRGGPGANAVVRDPALERTATQLAAASPAGRKAVVDAADRSGPSTQGFNECTNVPNGDLLVTQYLPERTRSGGLVALDGDLRIVAEYSPPERSTTANLRTRAMNGAPVTLPPGTPLIVSAREVQADPSHAAPEDQRALIVYDVSARLPANPTAGTGPVDVSLPNLVQEIRYDAVARRFDALTDLLVLRDARPGDSTNDIVRGETGVYAPDGTLFLALTHAESSASAATAVFERNQLVAAATTPGPMGPAVTPPRLLDAFETDTVTGVLGSDAGAGFASQFALTYDREHHLLAGVSLGGVLRAVRWDDERDEATSSCELDLGGGALAAGHPDHAFLPRQGVIDEERGVWYVPYQGVQSGGRRVPGLHVAQFLWAVDLQRLADRCGR